MAENSFYQALNRGDFKLAERFLEQLKNEDPVNIQCMRQQLDEKLGYNSQLEKECKSISEKRDYYEILGVAKSVDEEELKRTYKKLALKFHPDKCKCPSSGEAFKKVGQAFAVLSDSQKRAAFDKYGNEEGPQMTHSHGNGFYYYQEDDFDPNEIFNMFFGPGFFHQPMRRRQNNQQHQNQNVNTDPNRMRQRRITQWVQLMPLLMLLLISFLSTFANFLYVPAYNFQPSKDYAIKRMTYNGVLIYVNQNFEQDYKNKIQEIENQAEKEYLSYLDQQCDILMEKKNNYLSQARWYGNSNYGNKLREKAQQINMSKCDEYRQLYEKIRRTSNRRYYW